MNEHFRNDSQSISGREPIVARSGHGGFRPILASEISEHNQTAGACTSDRFRYADLS